MAYRIATTTRKRFYLRRNVRAGTRTLVALDLRIPAPETADPRAGLGTDRTQGNDLPRTLPAGRGALPSGSRSRRTAGLALRARHPAYDRNGFGNTQCTVLQGAFRVGPLVRSEANRLRRRHVFRQAGAGYLPPGRRTDRVVPFPVHQVAEDAPFGYRSGTESRAPA